MVSQALDGPRLPLEYLEWRSFVREAAPSFTIRVFLAIENRLLREALTRLCRKRPDLQVVREAAYRDSFAEEILGSECHVLVLDFLNPGVLRSLSVANDRESCKCKIVLIAMEDDPLQFLSAVRAGVRGYLLKDASASDVIAAVRAISNGQAICPPQLCASLFECVAHAPHQGAGTRQPHGELTLRQRQIVNLVAKGLTNKEIAAQLHLSEFTVRNHVHRILKQVDVASRQEVARVMHAQEVTLTW